MYFLVLMIQQLKIRITNRLKHEAGEIDVLELIPLKRYQKMIKEIEARVIPS